MMKYFLAMLLGLAVGAGAGAALIVHNPLAGDSPVSPLDGGAERLMELTYPAAPNEAILLTNNGTSAVRPQPAKVLQLWEDTVRKTRVRILPLHDAGGELAGFGIKYSSDSEASNLFRGEALVDSVWHIVLPGQGTLFVAQTENYWHYLRDVVLPSYLSGAKSWKGNWSGLTTVGPGVSGIAKVTGGAGRFADIDGEAVESHDARAFSRQLGPVSMDGRLAIELSDAGRQTVAAGSNPD